jgi:capsular polysaccharide biosynthesis protein
VSRPRRFLDGYERWRDSKQASLWLLATTLTSRCLSSWIAQSQAGVWLVDSRVIGWWLARALTRNLRAWQSTLDRRFFDVVRSVVVQLDEMGIVRRYLDFTVRKAGSEAAYAIVVSGWAGEPLAPTGHVEVRLGGEVVARSKPTIARPDLRAFFQLLNTPKSGFRATIQTKGNLSLIAQSRYAVTLIASGGRQYAIAIADGLPAAAQFEYGSSELECGGYVDNVAAFRREPFVPVSGNAFVRAGGMAPVLWATFLVESGFLAIAKALVWFARTDAVTGDPAWASLLYQVHADAAAQRSLEVAFKRAGQTPSVMPGVRDIVRVWRDRRDWLEYEELVPEATVSIRAPAVFEAESGPIVTDVQIPAVGIYTVKEATVLPHGVVIRGVDLVVVEPGADPASDFVAGQWSTIAGSSARPDAALVWSGAERELSVSRAVLLSTRVPENHFHFLIENLSRMYPLLLAAVDPIPLLVSKRINLACRHALAVCAPDWPVTWLDEDTVVHVEKLLVPTFPTNHPDTTSRPWIEGSALSYPFMDFLREKLLPIADRLFEVPEYVYLERKGTTARSLINANEVADAAVRRGFISIDPGALSLAEQVALFSRAKVIAGGGGASFANLVFAPPGTKVVALVSEQLHDFCMQSELARFAGADFMYVTGPSSGSRFDVEYHREFFHKPFSVDPEKFGRALDQAVTALSG